MSATHVGTLTIDTDGLYAKKLDVLLAGFDRDEAVRLEMAKLVAARLDRFPRGYPLTVSYALPATSYFCVANVGGRIVHFLDNGGVHVQVPSSAAPS